MKRSYNYFIIKPDGIRYTEEILEYMENNYQTVKYYIIKNYQDITKKLYYKNFEIKGEKFVNDLGSYLYGLTNLFGNQGLLILVADKNKTYEQLAEKVMEDKLKLRKKFSNNNIGIVTNYGEENKNCIKIINKNGEEEKLRILSGLGNYRISDMNIIHCPDANKETVLTELKILLDNKIMEDKNLLDANIINKIKEYSTIKCVKDKQKIDYRNELGPDISNFIKSEIVNESIER